MRPLNIVVLASGGGTNLQALIDEERRLGAISPYRILCVICDRTGTGAQERAARAGIAAELVLLSDILSGEERGAFSRRQKLRARSDAILALCKRRGAEAVVLAGFLSILAGKIIGEYDGRIINLHPALLPEFGGEGMWGRHVHQAVIAAGKTESGCTVHYVTSQVDAGEHLVQKKIPVNKDDTPETLAARLAPVEHAAIVEAVKLLAERLNRAGKCPLPPTAGKGRRMLRKTLSMPGRAGSNA
jgi:phosphoribosylglycinamide formyltransferase-1